MAALSSASLLRLMCSLCTILGTSNITNRTVIALILIASQAWSNRMSNMMAVFSVILLWDNTLIMEEKYPPDTLVEQVDLSTNMILASTVMDIPFSLDVSDSSHNASYTILFDNDMTSLVLLSEMADLIPSPLVCKPVDSASTSLLPPFLQFNSKITYKAHFLTTNLGRPKYLVLTLSQDPDRFFALFRLLYWG